MVLVVLQSLPQAAVREKGGHDRQLHQKRDARLAGTGKLLHPAEVSARHHLREGDRRLVPPADPLQQVPHLYVRQIVFRTVVHGRLVRAMHLVIVSGRIAGQAHPFKPILRNGVLVRGYIVGHVERSERSTTGTTTTTSRIRERSQMRDRSFRVVQIIDHRLLIVMASLQLDQALLVLQNLRDEAVVFCHQMTICNNCDMECLNETAPGNSSSLILSSKFVHRIVIQIGDTSICSSDRPFLDREECTITVNNSSCSFALVKEGMNELVPLWTMIGLYFMIAAVVYTFVHFWGSYKYSGEPSPAPGEDEDQKLESDGNAVTSTSAESGIREEVNVSKKRIMSLDAFRGATILLMIFVNYGGGGCTWFHHRPWYGLTIADLVFPAFVLIMGFSIALSTRSRLTAKKDFLLLVCKVLRRSAKLFALGIILNTDYTNLSELRVPGVLQRFALSYLFVALFHVYSVYRANKYLSRPGQITSAQLVVIFAPEIAAHCSILLIYLYFTFWFNYASECPKGYQGPGGLEEQGKFFNCTGGAANFLDRAIFGTDHIYKRPTSKEVYKHTLSHDPEGLLGLTTSILMTELGLICGRVLIKVRSHYRRLICWFILATCSGAVAALLTSTDLIPVVKNLWSLSFVCATAAICISLFILFYTLIDTTRVWTNGTPFHYPGANAILLYVGHVVLARYFPFYFQVAPSHSQLLAQVSFACFLWLIISMYLFRKRIFWVL